MASPQALPGIPGKEPVAESWGPRSTILHRTTSYSRATTFILTIELRAILDVNFIHQSIRIRAEDLKESLPIASPLAARELSNPPTSVAG